MMGLPGRTMDTWLMLLLLSNVYFPCFHRIISEGETRWNSGRTSLLSFPPSLSLAPSSLTPPNSKRASFSAGQYGIHWLETMSRTFFRNGLTLASTSRGHIANISLCYIWVVSAKNSLLVQNQDVTYCLPLTPS